MPTLKHAALICLYLGGLLLPITAYTKPKRPYPTKDPNPNHAKAPTSPAPPPKSPSQNKASLLEMARYLAAVHDQVQKNWHPQRISLMEMHKRSATFTLWFTPKGTLRKLKITHSSGSPTFDRTLTHAIIQSAPFPKPPTSILSSAQWQGLEIVFRKRVFHKKRKALKVQHRGQAQAPDWKKIRKSTKKR
ncbi:MAG: energy transducer TonB [Myxococcota bacterium]